MKGYKNINTKQVTSEVINCKIDTDQGYIDGVVLVYGGKGATIVQSLQQFRKEHIRVMVTKSSAN